MRHSHGREILSSILGIVLAPLLLAFLSVYFAFRLLLRLVFEVFAIPTRRRLLLVYSRSPLWQEHIETHWLPRLTGRAMVLNWSDRKAWLSRRSLDAWVFRNWAPDKEFNPMAIVFPRCLPARHIRFYSAFHKKKHGKGAALEAAERQLFSWLGESPRSEEPQRTH